MNAGKAIYYLLSNATSVTDICGTRIYPELAEQEAPTPFVVYEVISVDPDDTNDGPAKLDEVTVDITAVADVYDTCADLASAIRAAIDRIRGTYNGVNVDSVQYSTTDTDVMDSPRRYAMTAKYIVRISRDLAQIATGQPIDLLTILRLADTPSEYGTTGQALVMNAEGDALEWGETASALGDLTDVELTDLQDHEALVYDQDTATWINGASTKIGIRVINQTGGTLYAGTPLRATGVQGDQITVEIYNATQDGKRFIGLLSADIANGETGYARQTGTIYNLNTLRFNVGDILYPAKEIRVTINNGLEYMDSSFGVTGSDEPFAKIPCAIVLRRHFTTGRIYVRTWTPSRNLEDLTNVYTVGKQVNDVLRWNGYQWTAGDQLTPSLNDLRDVEITNPELIPNKSLLRWDAFDGIWRVIPETGGTIPALPNNIAYFLGRYNDDATTARQAADATLTIERYLTVQADGHGEEVSAQTDTPSSGNKIVRKIWHKAVSFEDSDVSTWTLVHTFDDDTDYNDTIATFNALLTAATYGSIPFSLAQTWEDVPAFTGLLDTYPGAVGGYSLRLLDGDYSGACVRVRRSGDNAEQDIGFDGDEIDRAALATFCSPGDGFVKTWYAQDGSGNNLTQGTNGNQLKIYDASTGIVLDANGDPCLDGSATTLTYLDFASSIVLNTNWSFIVVGDFVSGDRTAGGGSYQNLFTMGTSTSARSNITDQTTTTWALNSVGSKIVAAHMDSSSGNFTLRVNGTESDQTANTDSYTIKSAFYYGNVSLWTKGSIKEIIIYNSSKYADRAGIETNIANHYGITI